MYVYIYITYMYMTPNLLLFCLEPDTPPPCSPTGTDLRARSGGLSAPGHPVFRVLGLGFTGLGFKHEVQGAGFGIHLTASIPLISGSGSLDL